jgi:hypothetical protein
LSIPRISKLISVGSACADASSIFSLIAEPKMERVGGGWPRSRRPSPNGRALRLLHSSRRLREGGDQRTRRVLIRPLHDGCTGEPVRSGRVVCSDPTARNPSPRPANNVPRQVNLQSILLSYSRTQLLPSVALLSSRGLAFCLAFGRDSAYGHRDVARRGMASWHVDLLAACSL